MVFEKGDITYRPARPGMKYAISKLKLRPNFSIITPFLYFSNIRIIDRMSILGKQRRQVYFKNLGPIITALNHMITHITYASSFFHWHNKRMIEVILALVKPKSNRYPFFAYLFRFLSWIFLLSLIIDSVINTIFKLCPRC